MKQRLPLLWLLPVGPNFNRLAAVSTWEQESLAMTNGQSKMKDEVHQ